MKEKIYKLMSFMLVAGIAFSTITAPVYAAPDSGLKGLNTTFEKSISDLGSADISSIDDLFDMEYYAFMNPDVVLQYGYNRAKLLEHYLKYGIKEGRLGSRIFNVSLYKELYPELAAIYGDDWNAYVKHYFTVGIAEGRSNGVSEAESRYKERVSLYLKLTGINQNTINANTNVEINVSDNGIISDSDGNILIPWDVISREPYLTIETLRQRCGDSLVLFTDYKGDITFIGGNFSDVNVGNSESAKESLHCLMQILKIDENSRMLTLDTTGHDSLNNAFYRFVVTDEAGVYYKNSSIVVTADSTGEVLSVSSSSSKSWEGEAKIEEVDYDAVIAARIPVLTPDMKLYENQELVYVKSRNIYEYVNYYNYQGEVYRVSVNENGELCELSFIKQYGDGDYDWKKAIPYSETMEGLSGLNENPMEFVTIFGDYVNLNCHKVSGDLYYLYDKKNGIYCEVTIDDTYFDFVNKYKESEEAASAYLNTLEVDKVKKIIGFSALVAGFHNVQINFDNNSILNEIRETEKGIIPIQIIYQEGDHTVNAAASTLDDTITIRLYDSLVIQNLDVVSHELSHVIYYKITSGTEYANASGSINESYADILGNLFEMSLSDDIYGGYIDREKWLLCEGLSANIKSKESGVYEHPNSEVYNKSVITKKINDLLVSGDSTYVIVKSVRTMSDPELAGDASKVNGPNYIQNGVDAEYLKKNDKGGIHTNNGILNNVCYKMYQEFHAKDSNFSYMDLYNIWYDTLQYVTNDSGYPDMEVYVTQSLKLHGYSNDYIEITARIFDEANVDAYVYTESLYGAANQAFVYSDIEDAAFDKTDIEVENALEESAIEPATEDSAKEVVEEIDSVVEPAAEEESNEAPNEAVEEESVVEPVTDTQSETETAPEVTETQSETEAASETEPVPENTETEPAPENTEVELEVTETVEE